MSAQCDRICWTCFAQPGEPCRTLKTRRVTDTHAARIGRIGDHMCQIFDPQCYRCQLNLDEMSEDEG